VGKKGRKGVWKVSRSEKRGGRKHFILNWKNHIVRQKKGWLRVPSSGGEEVLLTSLKGRKGPVQGEGDRQNTEGKKRSQMALGGGVLLVWGRRAEVFRGIRGEKRTSVGEKRGRRGLL